MARAFSPDQMALLKSPDLAVNALVTFYLDEVNPDQPDGAWRFCDLDRGLYDGVHNYVGASALTDSIEVKSSQDLAAEPVTLVIDGNRMAQYGIDDPARVLRDILGYLFQQRRVDLALGFRYNYSYDVNLTVPIYAGKINYCSLQDMAVPLEDNNTGDLDPSSGSPQLITQLQITLDSLAKRYSRATNRVRSHQDQLELDPTDMFFSYVADAIANDKNLYWGGVSPVQHSYTQVTRKYLPFGVDPSDYYN